MDQNISETRRNPRDKKTVLITGASGYIGGNLAYFMSEVGDIYRTFHTSPLRTGQAIPLNITDKNEVNRVIQDRCPDLIIHTAAITNANQCAAQPQLAWDVNVSGTENIARAAQGVEARLIYLSTDLVFGGHSSFYAEEDIPTPICYYGKSKLAGEHVARKLCSRCCILRLALAYGWSATSSTCFTEKIIETLRRSEKINLFNDEFRTPVYITDVCQIITAIASTENHQDLYHVSGTERLSRYQFGLRLAAIFNFNQNLINPISVSDFDFQDERPRDCSLNSEKIKQFLSLNIRSVDQGLHDMASLK
ncbi:SDR family oxidoreductase [candidate division CSSED10-310 bacterium]|uniref:SDR family oxidoreductase n=1 Tax=candidate division CSSED10-310 bacterium TaxID=2855610 RepID=A0ABV6YU35_UNCC1